MKKTIFMLSILLATLLSFSFVSCLDDDEEGEKELEPVELSEYILGKWKVYKVEYTLDGKKHSLPLGKEGTASGKLKRAYMEVTFENEQDCLIGLWYSTTNSDDDLGWYENSATYSIDENTVTLHEAKADEVFTFDQSTRDLYMSAPTSDGTEIFLYMKK